MLRIWLKNVLASQNIRITSPPSLHRRRQQSMLNKPLMGWCSLGWLLSRAVAFSRTFQSTLPLLPSSLTLSSSFCCCPAAAPHVVRPASFCLLHANFPLCNYLPPHATASTCPCSSCFLSHFVTISPNDRLQVIIIYHTSQSTPTWEALSLPGFGDFFWSWLSVPNLANPFPSEHLIAAAERLITALSILFCTAPVLFLHHLVRWAPTISFTIIQQWVFSRHHSFLVLFGEIYQLLSHYHRNPNFYKVLGSFILLDMESKIQRHGVVLCFILYPEINLDTVAFGSNCIPTFKLMYISLHLNPLFDSSHLLSTMRILNVSCHLSLRLLLSFSFSFWLGITFMHFCLLPHCLS